MESDVQKVIIRIATVKSGIQSVTTCRGKINNAETIRHTLVPMHANTFSISFLKKSNEKNKNYRKNYEEDIECFNMPPNPSR